MAPTFKVEDIKIVFSAPNPDKATSKGTLTTEQDPALEANFQWLTYLVLFSATEGEDVNYYIFKMPLESDGSEKTPSMVFDSDSGWAQKGVTEDFTPGEIKTKFPEILKGPNLHPKQQVQYINDEDVAKKPVTIPTPKQQVPPPAVKESAAVHTKPYSSEAFKRLFDNNFYVVLNPKSKELKNPFGKPVGQKGEPSEEKIAWDSYRTIVRAAKESAMSGGFDIMQKLFKKQHKKQKIRKK